MTSLKLRFVLALIWRYAVSLLGVCRSALPTTRMPIRGLCHAAFGTFDDFLRFNMMLRRMLIANRWPDYRIAAVLLTWLSLQPVVGASGFVVEGVCETEDFNEKSEMVGSTEVYFTIAVSECSFDLKFKVRDSTEDYWQVTSDGTETYYLCVFQTDVEQMKSQGREVGNNIAGGTVLKRPVPNLGSYSPAGPIWAAYASGCYFSRFGLAEKVKSRSIPTEMDLVCGLVTASGWDVGQLREKRPAIWELFDDGGRPKEIVFYEYGFARTPVRADGSFHKIPLPTAYSSGFTNSHFRVIQHTNSEFGVLPLSSILATYWVKPNGTSSNDLWTRHVFKIRGTNFYASSDGITVPPVLPGITLIAEARFVEAKQHPKSSFSYMAEHRFPTEAEALSSEGYRKASPQLPALEIVPVDKSRARIVLLILFAGLLLWPIILFLRFVMTQEKPTNLTKTD